MSGQPQARVLFATLTECESARGNRYLRGWAGASNLVGFRGDDDEQGRPTWQLFLVERQPREGSQAPARRSQGSEGSEASATQPAGGGAPSSRRYRAPRPGSAAARNSRVAGEIAREYGNGDLNDEIPF